MSRLFGTDGVRGVANTDLTPELVLSLGAAAADVLAGAARARRAVAVVGRDPRASGEMLEAAVVAGVTAAGVDVVRVGVVPTPGVAYLTTVLGADFGVVLSASHNPMPDNGVKFFDAAGYKLGDAVEDEIERRLAATRTRPTAGDIGRVRDERDARERYVEHLAAAVDTSLDGIRVVVDCANGAASWVAPEALRRKGADVTAICAEPDGLNINDGCGSTHPERVAAAVREHGADIGLAHDGDADRCLAVDATGAVVDGDVILAIAAVAMHERGELAGDEVVTTVMTNLGFKQAMSGRGISVTETAVGDRYVLAAMRASGARLGGEQSGHLIYADHATTGDGVLTGLRLVAEMARTQRSLADLATVMQRLPQVLVNARVADTASLAGAGAIDAAVADATRELGGSGRVLVRASGTEPLVRVMVEAATDDDASRVATQIAAVVEREIGTA
ncbi:MAG: phosphoglucosamine mutase [Mycobacteriales bacterium]